MYLSSCIFLVNHTAMVCSLKCWVDLCLYYHTSGSEVVSESEVVMELWNYCSIMPSWYLKSKLLISNLIFLFFLGDKVLISATTMSNKSSLIGVECYNLLMSPIISNSFLGFSGAFLTSSFCFFCFATSLPSSFK